MLAVDAVAIELGLAAALLVVVVWLARELALAHRWRRLIDALHRVADALDGLRIVDDDDEAAGDG